jgi:hypothetical protein
MDRLRWMGLGVLLVAGAMAQCGYPDFIIAGSGGAGGGSSSTGGSCTVQHTGGGTCEYLPGHECGCSGGMKCSVVDDATGRSGCVASGSTPAFNQCSVDSDCAAELWCNNTTQACQPICGDTADCKTEGGLCEQALQNDGTTPIPGLNVCAAHCNLLSAQPCGPGLNCVFQTNKDSDCVLSMGATKHASCTVDSDCAQQLACIDLGLGDGPECLPWCTPPSNSGSANAQGCGDGFCYTLTPPVEESSVSYGICAD